MIKNKGGDGTRIFIWHDNWHPRGPLLQVYGTGGLLRLGLNTDAKLSLVIEATNLNWPLTRSLVLLEIHSLLQCVLSPTGLTDETQW